MTAWLTTALLLAIHDEHIAEHGGLPGLRDMGLLEGALARARNHQLHGATDMAELAALHALAIVRNHPFLDGNNRTAFVSMETFLALNGLALDASDAEATIMLLDMAACRISDAAFIAWVRESVAPD